jgi:hypothetical protein
MVEEGGVNLKKLSSTYSGTDALQFHALLDSAEGFHNGYGFSNIDWI